MSKVSAPPVKRMGSAKHAMQSNIDKLIREARTNEETLDNTMAACAAPILSFPETLNQLVEENRTTDIPKVQALTKSIRADLKEFAPKVSKLKGELENTANRPAGTISEMSDKYSKIFAVSSGMLELTGTVFGTAVRSTAQLEEILSPGTQSSPSEASL